MNKHRNHDIARWSSTGEGPFFERKSGIDRSGGVRKPRKTAEIAHDIAETLVAFANAGATPVHQSPIAPDASSYLVCLIERFGVNCKDYRVYVSRSERWQPDLL